MSHQFQINCSQLEHTALITFAIEIWKWLKWQKKCVRAYSKKNHTHKIKLWHTMTQTHRHPYPCCDRILLVMAWLLVKPNKTKQNKNNNIIINNYKSIVSVWVTWRDFPCDSSKKSSIKLKTKTNSNSTCCINTIIFFS